MALIISWMTSWEVFSVLKYCRDILLVFVLIGRWQCTIELKTLHFLRVVLTISEE